MEIDISHLNTVYYREIINRFKAFRSPALDPPVDDFWARSYGREKNACSCYVGPNELACFHLHEFA